MPSPESLSVPVMHDELPKRPRHPLVLERDNWPLKISRAP